MLLPALALGVASVFAAPQQSCLNTIIADPSSAPATLDDLSACQRKQLDDFAARWAQQHNGALPPDAQLALFEKRQKAETSKFLKAHPDQKPGQSAQSGVGVVNLQDDPAAAPDASADPQAAKPGMDLRPLADEDLLKSKLLGTTDDGKPNLSADGAKQVADYLNKKQGGPTGDMQGLMMELQKGGPPSADSIKKLKDAAGSMSGEKVPDVDQVPDLRAQ